jgi:predicted acetyltransferase
MPIEIAALPPERIAELIFPVLTCFGSSVTPERIARVAALPELDVRLAALDDGAVVGAMGSFTFDMTVPGGVAVETAGLTMVGVLPTHRRRGLLRGMMRRYLDGVRARGQAVSALFASEGSIYGRFGYGVGSFITEIEIERDRAAFARPSAPAGRTRLLGEDEALAVFPTIWDRVRLDTPGMLKRSAGWWRARRVADPDWLRGSRGPLQRVLLEIDGRPAAYALYRFGGSASFPAMSLPLEVTEAIGDSPEATRAIWRYLFDVDFVSTIRTASLPVDHPLLFLVAEPRRLRMRLSDGLWMRIVDVCAALSGRRYGEGGPLVIEVDDAFCPWNTGRYRLADGVAEPTSEPADLALDVDALGAAYLGGFGFAQLARAGRVGERSPGAIRRADALFRGDRAPCCPEIF